MALELKDYFVYFSSGDIYKYDKLHENINEDSTEYQNLIFELQIKYPNISYDWKNGFSFKKMAWQISDFVRLKFNLDRKLGDLNQHSFYIMTNLYSAPYVGCEENEIKKRMLLLLQEI